MERVTLPLVVASVLCLSLPAFGFQPPKKGGAKVTPTVVRSVVAWDGTTESLVLNADFTATKPVRKVAWVIPVPNVPTTFITGKPGAVDNVLSYVKATKTKFKVSKTSNPHLKFTRKIDAPLELPKPAPAFDAKYEIHPSHSRGQAGLDETQKWLADAGFAPIDAAAADYYLERGWGFVAVSAVAKKAVKSGRLPPIELVFDSKRPVLPLKLLAPAGPIPLLAVLVSNDAMSDDDANSAAALGFEIARGTKYTYAQGANPGTMKAAIAEFGAKKVPPALAEILKGKFKTPHVTVLFNSKFTGAQSWSEDFTTPPLKPDQKLMGGAQMPAANDLLQRAMKVRKEIEDGTFKVQKSTNNGGRPATTTNQTNAAPTAAGTDKGIFTSCSHGTGRAPSSAFLALLFLGFAWIRRRP